MSSLGRDGANATRESRRNVLMLTWLLTWLLGALLAVSGCGRLKLRISAIYASSEDLRRAARICLASSFGT